MNAIDRAKMAYGSTAAPVRTPKAVEYTVFARVTHQLKAGMSAGSTGPGGFSALAAALHDNRKLWAALAIDVADPDNALPAPLRAQIFYLHEFVAQHSSKVLRGQAQLAPLVEINTAIMRGLAEQGGAAR